MIAIINYEAGNLASVSNALERLGRSYTVTGDPAELERADGIIFPGVGHAAPAMESLRENGLDDWLRATSKPVLGICLGMQLLFESTEEGGGVEGLGLIPGRLKRFRSDRRKIPHMGWNTFAGRRSHPLLQGVKGESYFYFVHSYYAPVSAFTIAECDYITQFAAAAARENFLGVQFHPEKSGEAGALLLKNFLSLVG